MNFHLLTQIYKARFLYGVNDTSVGVPTLSFKAEIEQSAREKASNIVLALDLPPCNPQEMFQKAKRILDAVRLEICAVKLNRHLVLPLGLYDGVQELLSQAKSHGLPTIMDCKINDIGNTNRIIAEHYFNAGFGAVTANPFVGWEEGMEPVFAKAEQLDRGVILLVYMSHKGAWEGYGQQSLVASGQSGFQYEVFAKKALTWNASGAVVGATFPKKIEEVYSILGDSVPIYSPGIGAQGGNIESAIRSGAKYLIVGRTITLSEHPARAARNLNLVAQRSLIEKT